MLNSETFAKLLLSYGSFSNKKLQKLAYYVYSWYLTIYEEKIDELQLLIKKEKVKKKLKDLESDFV